MTGPWKLRGYVVERPVGRGGSADVWRARVSASGEPVALKRIRIADPEQVRRAHDEAALLSALDHPHLVRLHALVPSDDAMVLVLDLADRGSLRDLLTVRGRLAPGEVITALTPIAAALAYLHGEGVVHGDVSAANILFTSTGTPLLADVGVARLTGDEADAESTPAYVDPAVAVGGVPGAPSDVFMLGGVALHALTGSPPWPGDDAEAALAAARAGAFGGVDGAVDRLAGAGVPAPMITVVLRALAVDPHRRGTAAEFALDLRHSGAPTAVELSAGLPRRAPTVSAWTGPRHAAAPVAARSSPAAAAFDPARPAFERPSSGPGAVAAEPPTQLVGPRPRPAIPRPRRRRFSTVPGRPRARSLGAVFGVAAGLAVAAAIWARATGPGQAPDRQASALPTPGRQASALPTPAVVPSSAGSATAARTDWAAALAELDAVRARAFAAREPRLLGQVYVPGPLLDADAALIERIVPAGCGLVGARTHYGHVRGAVRGASVHVTATAALPPTRLMCGGRTAGMARPVGPTNLHVTLRRTPGGLRIADERVA
ncbi:MAG TPA: serine/threonine-protein kinase [Jatrophihabitans sp.]|nr:serine/threonine-protein kinase [Jatrophihabitans sp.]